ncbi:MAG: DUF4395 domain-containing protein [Mucilaginibacter sp.]
MNTDLHCPVDFVTINENQARLTALQVVLLTGVWIFLGYFIIPLLLTIDFFLRVYNFSKYSILNRFSIFLIKMFVIPNKPVERAPKRFAALAGFIFALSILVLSLTNITLPAKIVAALLFVFASLEAFAGFCAGCHVYSFFIRFKKKQPSKLR